MLAVCGVSERQLELFFVAVMKNKLISVDGSGLTNIRLCFALVLVEKSRYSFSRSVQSLFSHHCSAHYYCIKIIFTNYSDFIACSKSRSILIFVVTNNILMSTQKEDNSPEGSYNLKWSKIITRSFTPVRLFFNFLFLTYCLLPLSLIQFIPLAYIFTIVLRWLKVPFSYQYSLLDPKKSATQFFRRI